MHALKKIQGMAAKFEQPSYGESWAEFVRMMATHPRLGVIRASIFEDIKCVFENPHGILTIMPFQVEVLEHVLPGRS